MTDTMEAGVIRVGIGGWSYEPWRTTFYPQGLAHAKELGWASRQLTSIEINATYYRTPSAKTVRAWADQVPDDFVFSVKANRFATNRKDLAEAEPSVTRFVESGITELGAKLGPILWQFAPTKTFKADEMTRFVAALPRVVDGVGLRHVLEVRHPSFRCAEFVTIAREAGVAICLALHETYPLIADATAPFVYMRLQTSQAGEPAGYDAKTIAAWGAHAKAFAAGGHPDALPTLGEPAASRPRDCFVYMISGAKERNPAAAQAFRQWLT